MSWTALHSTGIFVGRCGEEDTMEDVVVVGVDLAKSVFQVHGIDAQGVVVLRRKLSRSKLLSFFAALPRCLSANEVGKSRRLTDAKLPNGGTDDPGEPTYDPALPSACNWSGPRHQRTRHHGQRPMERPHQQVEDMAASQQRSNATD